MDWLQTHSVSDVAYLTASVLFIMSLKGLAQHETARRGNLYGFAGMGIALLATLLEMRHGGYAPLFGTLLVGGIIGGTMAQRVAMEAMPQLVAMLHSFVGLAAVLVGFAHFVHGHADNVAMIEIFIGVWIGAITFTGSLLAYAKLEGKISGKPLLLPGRHLMNLAMLGGTIVLGALFVDQGAQGLMPLVVMTVIACVLGLHLVAAIGGADMPVVVSMLNSYSGWAAAAAGFLLHNMLLIVTGALVGSSGAILSYIMCRAMNRSIWSVIFGGFGTGDNKAATPAPTGEKQNVRSAEAREVADLLVQAKKVMIIPGYGMAVAKAQHPIRELTRQLQDKGIEVVFTIHPVAGRLPGHMNVLLAEANVPYDIVFEMDEVNEDIESVDVALVVGANDIVNPGALTDASSPIYGMPVIEAWRASAVIVLKRGLAAGYAGVDNPIYYNDNTQMYFGDAKASIEKLLAELGTG
jgi:NAD(P) transhydrogenase subunit beta